MTERVVYSGLTWPQYVGQVATLDFAYAIVPGLGEAFLTFDDGFKLRCSLKSVGPAQTVNDGRKER